MTDATAAAADATTGAQATNSGSDFLQSLPDDVRSDPVLKNFSGPDGHVKLANSFREARRTLSSRSMADLEPPADEAGRKAVLQKLGMAPPDTPDGYRLPDTPTAKQVRELAHKLGLSPKQAETWHAELQATESKAREEREGRIDKRKTELQSALKGEWGDEFDANMELAKRAAEHFIPEEERKILEDIAFPGLTKFLAAAGRALKEGTMHSGSGGQEGGAATLEAAQDASSKFFNEHKDLILSQNEMSPDVQRAKARHRELMAQVARMRTSQREATQASGSQVGGRPGEVGGAR